MALYGLLEPAIAALAGFLLLGQNLRGIQLLGIAVVVAASIGAAATAGPKNDVRAGATAPRTSSRQSHSA